MCADSIVQELQIVGVICFSSSLYIDAGDARVDPTHRMIDALIPEMSKDMDVCEIVFYAFTDKTDRPSCVTSAVMAL